MTKVKFTRKEIFDHAVANAGGLWYTTFLYMKSKGLSVEDWIDFVGKNYAPGWEEMKGKGALEVAHGAAANWVSCGAKLISLDGDETRAEAVLEWVSEEDTKPDGITVQEVQQINRVFFPITQFVGLKFSWKNEGKQFRLVFFKE